MSKRNRKTATLLKKDQRKRIIDINNNICFICGNKFEDEELTLHHKLRREYTGTNSDSNLVILCDKCHKLYHKLEKCIEYEYDSDLVNLYNIGVCGGINNIKYLLEFADNPDNIFN